MERNGFNIPSGDDLRAIRQSMPHLEREFERRQMANLESNAKAAGIKPGDRLCEICYGKILVISKQPSGYCLNCEKLLKDGQTAIVSMDGRYMFIMSSADVEKEKDMFLAVTGTLPDKWPDNFTIRGCVLPTPSARMDQLMKMHEQKQKQPEN